MVGPQSPVATCLPECVFGDVLAGAVRKERREVKGRRPSLGVFDTLSLLIKIKDQLQFEIHEAVGNLNLCWISSRWSGYDHVYID